MRSRAVVVGDRVGMSGGSGDHATTPLPVPVRAGRAPQWERLGALLESAARGHGRVLMVRGEPGIGKTTLLAMAAQHAARLGMRVARGSAKEIERILPFSALADCLEVTPGSPHARRARVAEILCDAGRFAGAA